MQQQQGGQHLQRETCVTFLKPALYLGHGQVFWDELAHRAAGTSPPPPLAKQSCNLVSECGNGDLEVAAAKEYGEMQVVIFCQGGLMESEHYPLFLSDFSSHLSRFLVPRKSTSKHSSLPQSPPCPGSCFCSVFGGKKKRKKNEYWEENETVPLFQELWGALCVA